MAPVQRTGLPRPEVKGGGGGSGCLNTSSSAALLWKRSSTESSDTASFTSAPAKPMAAHRCSAARSHGRHHRPTPEKDIVWRVLRGRGCWVGGGGGGLGGARAGQQGGQRGLDEDSQLGWPKERTGRVLEQQERSQATPRGPLLGGNGHQNDQNVTTRMTRMTCTCWWGGPECEHQNDQNDQNVTTRMTRMWSHSGHSGGIRKIFWGASGTNRRWFGGL